LKIKIYNRLKYTFGPHFVAKYQFGPTIFFNLNLVSILENLMQVFSVSGIVTTLNGVSRVSSWTFWIFFIFYLFFKCFKKY